MEHFWNSLIDFFLPGFCPGCGRKLPPDSRYICNECIGKIKRPGKKKIEYEFKKKFEGAGIISDFIALFLFEKNKELQNVIHALKYGRRFRIGIFLGELLGDAILKEFSKYQIDLVLPVPLHHLKKAEREYNQSYYIAKGICKSTGQKINNHFIKRIKYTESQTTLNISERERNLRDAFICKKKLKGENILIVDDVSTTGATFQECGRVLLNAGAGKVYAASVAVPE
ncbi:MAG TPA: ComF family protein [Ignavibacteriaceae bacterium]|nr:ComF family protein [Ignavibacteriaceae bacterium]